MIWSFRRPDSRARPVDSSAERTMHSLITVLGRQAEVPVGVLLHAPHHQFLVQRAAVDADSHRLALVGGDLADRGELLVAPPARPDVARVDPVLVERARAVGVAGQQEVAVVVEVADERGVAAGIEQAALDLGHGGRGFGQVHRDAQQFRSRAGQFETLLRGGRDVGRVGVAHRLDDDGRPAADLDLADPHPDRLVPCHRSIIAGASDEAPTLREADWRRQSWPGSSRRPPLGDLASRPAPTRSAPVSLSPA